MASNPLRKPLAGRMPTGPTAKMAVLLWLAPALQLEQASLPGHEKRRALAFIGRHGIQRAARRNKGSLQSMLIRNCVPAAAQRFGSLLRLSGRTCSHPASPNGPRRFGQEQSFLSGIAKGLAATRRKVAKIRRLARSKGLRGFEQQAILEDVEGGTIGGLRLFFAP